MDIRLLLILEERNAAAQKRKGFFRTENWLGLVRAGTMIYCESALRALSCLRLNRAEVGNADISNSTTHNVALNPHATHLTEFLRG